MNDGARGCFKFGCIGCLTLIGLAVAMVFLFGALQLSTDWGEPRQENQQLAHPLPSPPPLPPFDPTSDQPQTIPVGVPGTGDEAIGAGRLVLDLSMGEFVIRPGDPGQPIEVKADYDANAFTLKETFTARENDGWTYEVSFGGRGGFLGLLMRGGVRDGQNRIEIIVPRDHPVTVVGKIGMGESEVDLGGLWVRDVDLDFGTGDHFLEFREPTRAPMGSFAIDSSMGQMEVRSLGDASPSEVRVDHSMGELLVDLEGQWRNDSTVEVDFGMGACRLWLPEDARIEVERAKVSMGEKRMDLAQNNDQLPADAPTLQLDLSGSMGELSVKQ